jgi:hypothetical protein
MPDSVTKLELNKKYDRYNYRIIKNLRSTAHAAAVLKYLNNQRCMPFKNGMGYSLDLQGSVLVLVTNRCACDIGEHQCLTQEMKGDEYRMVCSVFDKAVKEAEQAVGQSKPEPTSKLQFPNTLAGELIGEYLYGPLMK